LAVNQVPQKSLLHLNPFDSEPQIVIEKYIAPTYLGENLTTYLSMDFVICNRAFSKNHHSILHTLPPLVVEMTYALQVFILFSELICPTLDSNLGFL
jgi:hypothetical protein